MPLYAYATECGFFLAGDDGASLLWIDEVGNLFTRGLIGASEGILGSIVHHPFNAGGPSIYAY